MKHKKNITTYAIIILILLIAVTAGIFYYQKKPTETPEQTANITTPVETGANFGDMVTINFILELENGTVVDTNDYQLAEENNIKDYVKGPYTFILGQSGKVPGFDEALTGMNLGDHREKTIEPSEKEVVLEINKVQIKDRFITINKKQAFSLKSYPNLFGKPPIKGDIIYNTKFAFKYKVINITEEDVIAEIYAKEGEEYTLPSTEWKSQVFQIAENDIKFYYKPKENQTIQTPYGPATINLTKSTMYVIIEPELNKIFNKSIEVAPGFAIPQQFQITDISEESFTIKRYNVLAEKRLKIKADLLNITKDVKEVKQKEQIITDATGGTEN